MFSIKTSVNNPILQPIKKHKWEEVSATNGSVFFNEKKNKFFMTYRAVGNPDLMASPHLYSSTVCIAESDDNINYENRRKFITPTEDYDKNGCEDPRTTYFEGKYYTFYTGISDTQLNKDSIKVAVGISDDTDEILEKHPVTPFNAKAMALFPERIYGKITVVLTTDTDNPDESSHICIAQCEKIEELWSKRFWDKWYKNRKKHIVDVIQSEGDHYEVGAVPVKTKDGWLLIYSRMKHYFEDRETIFGISAALLKLKKPTEIIGMTTHPIITPVTNYSKYGFVSNVVFPTGAYLNANGILDVFYGAADTTVAKSSMRLNDLLDEIKPKTKLSVFNREPGNPILKPLKRHSWESRDVFNPAAIEIGKKIYILYRSMSNDNTSTIGLAVSKDGINIDERLEEPIYVPREEFEQKKGDPNGNSGCEDPRVSKIGNKIYMTYTAYNGVEAPQVAVSHIKVSHFKKYMWDKWSTPVLLTPRGVDDKDACFFDKKINNEWWFIHRISSHVCVDTIEDLEFNTGEIDKCMDILAPRPGMWDSLKVGVASPPHRTKWGWLMFYHGVSDEKIYQVGAVLLKLDDPTEIIGRSVLPIFIPERKWEIEGEIPNVVFPCGSVIRKDKVFLYYGGADTVVGVATASLKKIISKLI